MSREQIEQTLTEFGQGVGLKKVKLNDDGVVCLKISTMGQLYIETLDNENVAIYVSRELMTPASQYYRKMLRMTDLNEQWPYQVFTALKDEKTAIFLVKTTTDQFLLPQLEDIIRFLIMLQDRLVGRG